MSTREMTLAELAERAGVPPRTIRFYISRGLLPGPLRRGRNAAYGPAHLEALAEIRRLRDRGLTLAQVRARLADSGREDGGPASSLPEPSAWWHVELAPGVRVQVRADLPPWRLREIREALAELAARLRPTDGGPDGREPAGPVAGGSGNGNDGEDGTSTREKNR